MNLFSNRGLTIPICQFKKVINIMRITIVLCLLTTFCAFSSVSYSQTAEISLDLESVTLREAMNAIKKQSDFSFWYRDDEVNLSKKLSVKADRMHIDNVMSQLLAGQNLSYTIDDNHIIIYKRNGTNEVNQRGRRISGIIKDEFGEPVVGANIFVKGTTIGTTTDIDGKFNLEVEKTNEPLVVSYIGYNTREITIGNNVNFVIQLSQDTQNLEEVVVVGYGSVAKKELTSAISHVSSKDFLNISSVDPSMMIQGKVSGVSVTNTGMGDPNNQASIQIRGISSRSAGLGPLIVIDGVPGGNLTNINPNDIESMDILKDGAASAIYGTRGSNGVVLVTTKKGARDGQLHASYSGTVSANFMVHDLDPLGADEFRKYRVPNNQGVDQGGNTNWMDEISRTGFAHQHTLTISGGNTKSNYRASIDYKDANGIDIRSNRKEYGARFSINHATKSGLLNFSANVSPRFVYRNNSDWSVFRLALEANPTTPVFDPKIPGQYSNFNGQAANINPVELLKLDQSGGETKLLDWDATVKLNLLPLLAKDGESIHSLNTQVTLAQQQNDNFNFWFRPATSTLAQNSGRSGEASRDYGKSRQESLEWLINYAMEKKEHRLKVMGGYSYQYFQNSGMSAANKDFPSDILSYNNLSQGEWAKEEGRNEMGSYKNDSKLIAFFGRVNYDYKGRYLLAVSYRYEGSSKFGKNNKWGHFPAVSAGWRISDESFMKNVSWINDLKIRGDFGVTGNQDFDSYKSLATMQGFGSYYYNGQYFTVWGPAKNPNYDLKWEKGLNWNVGVDFTLFSNRVYGSLNYYSRKQQDLLGNYNVAVPPYLFAETFVNVGNMVNKGLEIDLNVQAVRTKDFSYNIGFVGSTNNNKFLNFSNNEFTGQDFYNVCDMESPGNPGRLQQIREGERLGNYYTWVYAGVDDNGNWLVWNKDNTEKISINDAKEEDKRVTGNGLPKFTASLSNTFTYKNWDLTVYLRGAFGYDLFNVHDLYYGLQNAPGNVLKKAYDKNAAITTGQNVLTDYFIEKGDYVKLDVVTLGYRFNINNKWLESIRLYATGKNLATITGFSGVDPSSYQLNGLTPGTNNGTRNYYPTTIQMLFGLQLEF
ncbi:MAG: TonB-dependent receptor SusC [Parabacteroides sp.]